MLLPAGRVLADTLLQTHILACLLQPAVQAWPLPNQCLMADFQDSCSSHRLAWQKARPNKGLGDLPEDDRFFGIEQQQFGAGCAASCGDLPRCSWLDQAQEQGPCQPAMLLRR